MLRVRPSNLDARNDLFLWSDRSVARMTFKDAFFLDWDKMAIGWGLKRGRGEVGWEGNNNRAPWVAICLVAYRQRGSPKKKLWIQIRLNPFNQKQRRMQIRRNIFFPSFYLFLSERRVAFLSRYLVWPIDGSPTFFGWAGGMGRWLLQGLSRQMQHKESTYLCFWES